MWVTSQFLFCNNLLVYNFVFSVINNFLRILTLKFSIVSKIWFLDTVIYIYFFSFVLICFLGFYFELELSLVKMKVLRCSQFFSLVFFMFWVFSILSQFENLRIINNVSLAKYLNFYSLSQLFLGGLRHLLRKLHSKWTEQPQYFLGL